MAHSGFTNPEPNVKRPRIHPSTCVAVSFVLLVLVLANLVGQFTPRAVVPGHAGRHYFFFFVEDCSDHGWPQTWLRRERVWTSPTSQRLSIWQLTEGVAWCGTRQLFINVAVSIGLACVAGILFEWWRRQRNRWYQFSLREFFVLGAVFSAMFVGLCQLRARARYERSLLPRIAQIQERHTTYSDPIEDRVEWSQGGPSWLRAALGDEYFRSLDRVVRFDTNNGEVLELASELRELRVLQVAYGGPGATTRQLEFLKHFEKLEALCLADFELCADADDQRWLRIPKLPRLRALIVCGIPFRGDSLAHLDGLEQLWLCETDVSDDALRHVGKMRRLKELYLYRTRVTGEGLRHLKHLDQLEELSLSLTKVDDKGLAFLPPLSRLNSLRLYGTKITDRSIPTITRFQGLEYLEIIGTEVSPEGKQRLQAALSNCNIP